MSNILNGTAIGSLIILFAENARVLITWHWQTSVHTEIAIHCRSEGVGTSQTERLANQGDVVDVRDRPVKIAERTPILNHSLYKSRARPRTLQLSKKQSDRKHIHQHGVGRLRTKARGDNSNTASAIEQKANLSHLAWLFDTSIAHLGYALITSSGSQRSSD